MVDYIIRIREKSGAEYELARIGDAQRTWQCGRSSEMDIPFGKDDKSISRHQFDLIRKRSSLVLVNRGRPISAEGKTLATNKKIRIKDGIEIRLSNATLRFFASLPAKKDTYDLILREGIKTRQITLGREKLSIGKHESNDVVVDADGVSRLHLELSADADKPGSFLLSDVGSRNGFAITKPTCTKYSPGDSCTLSSGASFKFGAATATIAKHRSALSRRRPLLIAGSLVGLIVLFKVLNPPTPMPAACVQTIAEALRNEDGAERVQAILTLSRAHDGAIMACEDCRGKLSELGELAIELQQWTLRKNEIKNAREALRNELSRGLWDRSEKTTQERNERITRLRTLHEQFLRFDTSRFISDPVVASAQSEERNSRLDENVEVSRGLGDSHEPVEWPPLMNVSEVKTETRAIADETQALLDAVDGLSGMLEVIFKEGVPGDRDQFQSALSAVLVHDDLASARQQWEAYVSARDIIQTNWTALAETYLGILKEESAAEIPPAWVCSPDVPPVFQSSMEDIFAKPLYAYLRSLDIAGGFSPQSPAKRFHFVQSMLDEWPRLERIPEQANTIRAAARQYLERQHEIWKKTAHAVEVLADGIRLARRDWAGQENQALTIQMVSVIRDIEKRLPESSQQLFAIPVRGYENERLRLRAQEMLEAEWEALRVVVEGKLYDGVRAQIGQPADKEGLQKLGVLAGRYTAIEKDLIENGLLRRNRIAGFARIDRRIKQELERL